MQLSNLGWPVAVSWFGCDLQTEESAKCSRTEWLHRLRLIWHFLSNLHYKFALEKTKEALSKMNHTTHARRLLHFNLTIRP